MSKEKRLGLERKYIKSIGDAYFHSSVPTINTMFGFDEKNIFAVELLLKTSIKFKLKYVKNKLSHPYMDQENLFSPEERLIKLMVENISITNKTMYDHKILDLTLTLKYNKRKDLKYYKKNIGSESIVRKFISLIIVDKLQKNLKSINKTILPYNKLLKIMKKYDKELPNYYEFNKYIKSIPGEAFGEEIVKYDFPKFKDYLKKLSLKKMIKNKDLVDMSKMGYAWQFIYGYLPYYIKTVEDMVYFSKLLQLNIKEKVFLGYAAASIYDIYKREDEDSQPTYLRLFLERGLGLRDFDILDYKDITEKHRRILDNYEFEESQAFFDNIRIYF